MKRGLSGARARVALFAAAGGAALLVGAHGAQAAEATAQAQDQPNGIGEVVVTAQRRSQNIQDVPLSVQAVSAKDITAAGIKSTQDLGQITPNVTIISPIGAGNQPLITIRGIGLNDFDTNNAGPNGVYVDDVYISAPSAQNFAMFDIDQVQVLKGPQGTLYGRNTSGGALVFNSKRPTNYLTGDFHLEYGAYNTLQAAGAVGGPITEDLSGRIAFVYNHSDGYTYNALTKSPIDNVNNEALRLQLQYKPNDRLKIYLEETIGYVRNHPQPYGHIGVFQPGTQNTPSPVLCSPSEALAGGCVDLFGWGTTTYWSGSYDRLENLTNLASITQGRVDYDFGPATLTSITSFQYDHKHHPEETDASPNNLIEATYGVSSKTFTQEFRLAHTSHTFNWVAGVYYLREKLTQNQPISFFYDGDLFGGYGLPAAPGSFDGTAQISYDQSKQITNTAAAFAQGDYTWNQFTLTLGGRYTWERKSFDYYGSTQFQDGGRGNYGPLIDIIDLPGLSTSASNATYRVALAYHFNSLMQAYGSIASGFKSGGFNGSFLSNDLPTARAQLTPVKPEKVTSYEIGEKATFFDHRLVVNTALFYNAYDDEQIFGTVPVTLVTQSGVSVQSDVQLLTNAKRSHTEGIEMQVIANPFHGLTIDLEPAWLRTRLDDAGLATAGGTVSLVGNELANSPKFTFTAVLNYRYDLPNDAWLNFRWNSNYRSHYWFDTTNDPYLQQNGYWLHNLNIDYNSPKNWSVGVYVRNLANEKYQLTSSDISALGFLEPVLGAPRTYGVQLSYHF